MNLSQLHMLLTKSLAPVSKLVGRIHLAPKSRAIKAHHIVNAIDVILRPGDVIIAYAKGELTNVFIEGEYKHAAMYCGDGIIVEAVGDGVRAEAFDEFCSSKDRIAIIRASFCSAEVCLKAVESALNQIGKSYDYAFEPNEKAFYCAELVAYAYQCATDFKSPFVVREIMGVETVLPDDFKLAVKKFDLIAEIPK